MEEKTDTWLRREEVREPKQAGETLYPPRVGAWPGAASNPADTRIMEGLGGIKIS